MLSYLFDSSVLKSEKTIVLIDLISIILIVPTAYLIADIIARPASLGRILLIDGSA